MASKLLVSNYLCIVRLSGTIYFLCVSFSTGSMNHLLFSAFITDDLKCCIHYSMSSVVNSVPSCVSIDLESDRSAFSGLCSFLAAYLSLLNPHFLVFRIGNTAVLFLGLSAYMSWYKSVMIFKFQCA